MDAELHMEAGRYGGQSWILKQTDRYGGRVGNKVSHEGLSEETRKTSPTF